MKINFGKVFQQFSKDKGMRGLVNIPQDSSSWPESWKVVSYKTYDRFPKIGLPQPEVEVDLASAVTSRVSVRKWGEKPVTLKQISNILYYSCGLMKDKEVESRAQPSGGARYPLEAYVIIYKKGELEQKLYHYNVKEHALDVLWDIPQADLSKLCSYGWATEAGFMVVLTGVVNRTVMKYGERGYRYIYIEAGGIANNINILAKSQGLGVCIMGGTNDSFLESLLDIDGEQETVVLGLVGGVL